MEHSSSAYRLLATTIVTAIITSVVTVSVIIGGIYYHPQIAGRFLPATPSTPTPSGTLAAMPAEDQVVAAVRAANPAVVAITVSKDVPVYEEFYRRTPGGWGGFFDEFFNFSVPEVRQNGTERREVGGGSGFIISADGYIVTNRHVVDDDEAAYAVFLNDGTKYDATVIARDTFLDIAVVKIEGTDLPHIAFGDSDTLEPGATVIAIGNALAEFRNTVSVGVVSGLARSITASDNRGQIEDLDQLIQTDAAINQGNSGGPLLNLKGEVIGVNVAVAAAGQNIGFALSSNSVRSIIDSVRETGEIVRPYIGVRYLAVTPEIAERNNLEYDYGMLVQRGEEVGDLAVIPGSPADKAGIVENDIILSIDGEKLDAQQDLARSIRQKQVGEVITLEVLQRGTKRTIDVTLEALP